MAINYPPTKHADKVDVIHDELVSGQALSEQPKALAEISHWNSLSTLETLKVFRKTTFICILVGFNACSDGFQFALPGQIIANTGFIQKFGAKNAAGTYALDAYHIAAWGGMYTGAYIFILLLGTWPNDQFGRKFCLLFIQVFMAVACIFEMVAQDWHYWLVAKMFDGFSVGLNQSTLAAYISELAPTRARGALLGIYQFWFALGQFSAAIALNVLSKTTPTEWKRAIYSEWVFTGLALIIWLVLPESPRWLCSHGKHERAKTVLRRLNGQVVGYDVEHEYGILVQEVEEGKRLAAEGKSISITTLFRGTNLRRTLISFGPFAWQTWLGSPIIFGYTSYYFQLAGLTQPFLGTVAVYLILLFGVVASFWTVEKVGRRPLLLTGGIICICSMLINGGVATRPYTTSTGSVIITFACVWVAAYAVTAGPLGYAYLGETSTVVLRAKTTGVAAAMTGMLNLITNYCTPLLLSATAANWGVKGTSFFFAGTGALGWILIYFFIPETKGRSFLELDELFERRIPAGKFKQTQTSIQTSTELSHKVEDEA